MNLFHISRRNLAVWFTTSMGSIAIVFASLIFYLEAKEQMRAFDRSVLSRTRTIASAIESELDRGEWEAELDKVPVLGSDSLFLDSESIYIRWYDKNKLITNFVGPFPEQFLRDAPGFKTLAIDPETNRVVRDRTNNLPILRQLTLPVLQNETVVGYIQVGVPLTSVEISLTRLAEFIAISIPLALATIGGAGWFLSGIAMQPIRNAYDGLERFTANASHELRAPLAAMLSNIQIEMVKPARNQRQLQQRLEKLANITKSMSVLVNNLLFLARHERSLLPLELPEIDLLIFLQEVGKLYQEEAEKKNLEFILDLPTSPLYLTAEPDLLRQAVVNLLSNAIKYTPAGGRIDLRLVIKNRQALIQVEDNGIGIPSEVLSKIFERFYRVDPVRTPQRRRSQQIGGFGLGLAIAEQIVKAHRGKITVTSQVDRGSCFQIELPLTK